jgi:alpha-tubulin suppressor-like RCC1 family protein/CRP-like cAMP-binding protein
MNYPHLDRQGIRRFLPRRPIPVLAVLVSVAALVVSGGAGGKGQEGLTGVAAVGGGGGHALAAKKNGTVWAWGHNAHGQLGLGRVGSPVLKPTRVPGIKGVTQTIGGEFHTVVLKKDGTVWAWGDNESGQLGTGRSGSDESSPVQVKGITDATAVDADGDHSYALLSDGTVRAWGENDEGQLGNGTTTESNTPVRVSIKNVAAIATGSGHALALTKKGVVLAWGDNRLGQLGIGAATEANRTTPVKVKGLPGRATAIAAGSGGDYSLALMADGTVWAWGLNAQGQLGNGSFDSKGCKCRPKPARVHGVKGAIGLAASGGAGLALKANGTVWAWGNNEFGQLGRGVVGGKSAVPKQVEDLTGVKALTAGGGYVVALKSDDSVVAFGMNTFGQLGIGNTSHSAVPVAVGVTAAASNDSFSLGPLSALGLALVVIGALVAIAAVMFGRSWLRRRAVTRRAAPAAPQAAWDQGADPRAAAGQGAAPGLPVLTPGAGGLRAPAAAAGGPPAADGAADAYSRRVQLLQATGHFDGVSHDVLAQVATMLKPLAVPADGIVCREGEPGDHFFLIESGTLAVTTDLGGHPRELALLGSGQFFGETALLDQATRAATVRATTNAQLWALSAEDFQHLRARHPEIETAVQKATARRDATRMGGAQRTIAAGQPLGHIRIGRSPDNDMVFSSDLVSGHHAEIELLGGVARLSDLDSTNGTFVNEVRVSTAELNDGDEIRVGDERFTFDRRAIQASVAAQPQAEAPR